MMKMMTPVITSITALVKMRMTMLTTMFVMIMRVMLTLTLLDAITLVVIRSLLRMRANDDPRPLGQFM